jgi:xanthine/CO dehydrogenase XdhC/CoxF family maturation factor
MTTQDMIEQSDVFAEAQRWKDSGLRVAIATVVSTWGSSPRPVGSQMLVDNTGHFVGSVSAGCIESAVVREALDVIEQGKPKLLEYGITNQSAWEVGLACGGRVEVFVERVE